jgi:hypothetical protein
MFCSVLLTKTAQVFSIDRRRTACFLALGFLLSRSTGLANAKTSVIQS